MPSRRCNVAHQLDNAVLVVRVEAHQRFVEQQQPRPAEQRLRQQQPLPLAAGNFPQWPTRQFGRADQRQHALDLPPVGAAKQRQPPAVAGHGAGDEVPAAQVHARGAADLRHVADHGVAERHGRAEHPDAAAHRPQQP